MGEWPAWRARRLCRGIALGVPCSCALVRVGNGSARCPLVSLAISRLDPKATRCCGQLLTATVRRSKLYPVRLDPYGPLGRHGHHYSTEPRRSPLTPADETR